MDSGLAHDRRIGRAFTNFRGRSMVVGKSRLIIITPCTPLVAHLYFKCSSAFDSLTNILAAASCVGAFIPFASSLGGARGTF